MPSLQRLRDRIGTRIGTMLFALSSALLALFHLLAWQLIRKLPNSSRDIPGSCIELRDPSSSSMPSLTVTERLIKLEEKLEILDKKELRMPRQKEELLNAAIQRIDALESELIATKRVSKSSLIHCHLSNSKLSVNYPPKTLHCRLCSRP